MGGMIEWVRSLFNADKRRYERHSVADGAGVVVAREGRKHKILPIADISLGGLAFMYEGNGNEWDNARHISLYGHDDLYLNKIRYNIVTDQKLADLPEREISVRRQGIQFLYMNNNEKVKLAEYISAYAH